MILRWWVPPRPSSVLHVDEMPQAGKSTAVYDENFMHFTNGGKGFNIVAGLHKLGNSVYPVLTYCDATAAAEPSSLY